VTHTSQSMAASGCAAMSLYHRRNNRFMVAGDDRRVTWGDEDATREPHPSDRTSDPPSVDPLFGAVSGDWQADEGMVLALTCATRIGRLTSSRRRRLVEAPEATMSLHIATPSTTGWLDACFPVDGSRVMKALAPRTGGGAAPAPQEIWLHAGALCGNAVVGFTGPAMLTLNGVTDLARLHLQASPQESPSGEPALSCQLTLWAEGDAFGLCGHRRWRHPLTITVRGNLSRT